MADFQNLLEKGGSREATGGLVVSEKSEHQSSALQTQQSFRGGARIIVTNPPYGKRLHGGDFHELYTDLTHEVESSG